MDSREALVVAEVVALIFILIGGFVNEFFNFTLFIAFEALFIALFFLILWKMRSVFGRGFIRYLLYFLILFCIILASLLLLVMSEKLAPRFDIFLVLVIALIITNVAFRVIFGKKELEGRVLLSDDRLAVVELPFDLFAGIPKGKYVVETDTKIAKGKKVKVKIKQTLFKRVPERIVK
ncbi:MAG: DUF2101 family protein [Candidatus Diapherotrites archaeon]|nr:DUF2101 family protein [Candidatus Diapherotrites archaeon]